MAVMTVHFELEITDRHLSSMNSTADLYHTFVYTFEYTAKQTRINSGIVACFYYLVTTTVSCYYGPNIALIIRFYTTL